MKGRHSISMKTDHAVREWSTVCPAVRSDLRFHYQDDQGEAVYVVEDLITRRYHQLGLPEYRFLRSLDGTRTVAQLIAKSAFDSNRLAMSEHEVSAFLRWALDNNLLDSSDVAQAGRRSQLAEEREKKKPVKTLTKLLFLKIPAGNPDAFMSWANRLFGWTFSIPAMLVWIAVVGFGVFSAIQHRERLYDAGSMAILPANWLYLILVYAVLKVIHEIWHGIATKRFGGVVPEWGIQLIAMVTPLTYVDASSSWGFSSRYRRILVSFAGMYIEFFIAALAVLVWLKADPAWARALAANVVISASVVTLLFNANPLMRFDGYYILSDLCGIRNLSSKGQGLMKWLGSRIFLGIKKPLPPGSHRHFFPLLIYGFLALGWRLIITVGILAIIANLFKGAGLAIMALFVAGGVVGMLISFVKMLGKQKGRAPLVVFRLACWIGVGAMLLRYVPVNPAVIAVAVVQYQHDADVRAECPGFVRELYCQDGDLVESGQLLARAVNPEETAMLAKIRLDLGRSEQRSLHYLAAGLLAAREAEEEVIKGLQDRLSAQQARVDSLEFRAPASGRLHAPDLASMKGQFLSTGQHLLTVFPMEKPALLVSASQNDAEQFESGDSIRVRLRGRQQELSAVLKKVEKQAGVEIPHPALASVTGGPLAVRNLSTETGRNLRGVAREVSKAETVRQFGGRGESSINWQQELATARLSAEAELTDELAALSPPLAEGEWGKVLLNDREPEPLGSWAWKKIVRYVRDQFEKSTAA